MSQKSGDYVGRILMISMQHVRDGSKYTGLYQHSEGAPSPPYIVEIDFNKATRALTFSYNLGKDRVRRFKGILKEDGIHGKFDDTEKAFSIPRKCSI
jgi:hypothetical protein